MRSVPLFRTEQQQHHYATPELATSRLLQFFFLLAHHEMNIAERCESRRVCGVAAGAMVVSPLRRFRDFSRLFANVRRTVVAVTSDVE